MAQDALDDILLVDLPPMILMGQKPAADLRREKAR
jgi:hypothetical protein